ncbi:hypothetical protein D3C73_1657180 [compost metagenome]
MGVEWGGSVDKEDRVESVDMVDMADMADMVWAEDAERVSMLKAQVFAVVGIE